MNAASHSGTAESVVSLDGEFHLLLNLIESRLRRKEIVLAEEFAAELLDKAMDFLLHEKVARMNRLNRLLTSVMKLLLGIVCASVLLMVLNIQPFLGLKIFTAGYILIALLAVVNYFLVERFHRTIHAMTETYKTESQRFIALLLDSVRVDDNPETALNMFCLAMMQ